MKRLGAYVYLKLFYSLREWEWYNEPNTLAVFIHLLLLANRRDQPYKNDIIRRGEALASLDFLSEETGLTVQNIRTALEHLKSTGTLTQRKIGKTSVFSIVSYDKYQSGNTIVNNEVTTYQHRTNNELTTPIECNNDTLNNNIECESVNNIKNNTNTHGRYKNVILTESEFKELKDEYPDDYQNYIDRLDEYIASTGKQYNKHAATIRKWIREDKAKKGEHRNDINAVKHDAAGDSEKLRGVQYF